MNRVVRGSAFFAAVFAAAGTLVAATPKNDPLPSVHPSDEQYLLNMRDQLRPASGPQLLEDVPAEQKAEFFKNGLRKAAAEYAPSRPETPSRSPRIDWDRDAAPQQFASRGPHSHGASPPGSPAWLVLLESAMNLERVAHELDQNQQWDAAERIRRTAAELRSQARSQVDRRPLIPASAFREPSR